MAFPPPPATYTPSPYFGALAAVYDVTEPPYYLEQPVMVPIDKTIQLGMGLWLPGQVGVGTYSFTAGSGISSGWRGLTRDESSTPDEPFIRHLEGATLENGPYFQRPVPFRYGFSPPLQSTFSLGYGEDHGSANGTAPERIDTSDPDGRYNEDIGWSDVIPFVVQAPGPPEWATQVGISMTFLDDASWGNLTFTAKYQNEPEHDLVTYVGEPFQTIDHGRSHFQVWDSKNLGHNFIGGQILGMIEGSAEQVTLRDWQEGKRNGGYGKIGFSVSYTKAWPHMVFVYQLVAAVGPDDPGPVTFPCPPSTWPYNDPSIGASPGPTGVIRWDRWK